MGSVTDHTRRALELFIWPMVFSLDMQGGAYCPFSTAY